MSREQADAAASTSASTVEQAYAVWEALAQPENRRRTDGRAPATTATNTPRAEMALRAALHPLLRPALDDPLATVGGAYVSLDAQVTAFAAAFFLSPTAPKFWARLPDADRAMLARLGVSVPQVNDASSYTLADRVAFASLGVALPAAPPSPSASPRVGAMEGVLFVPGLRAGVVCGVRVWIESERGDARRGAALWQRERLGWEPPRAVRPVAPAIGASAGRALRAALLLLCAEGALPPDLRPSAVYFDICAPLADDQMVGIAGESLELPLTLAMLSALTRQPLAVTVGATGAIGIDESAGRLSVEPVGELAAKAAAFFADFPADRGGANDPPRFLVPEETGKLSLAGVTAIVTEVATLRDAVALALPGWKANAGQAIVDSPATVNAPPLPVSLHACIESEALCDAPALRRQAARLLGDSLRETAAEVRDAAAPNRLRYAARFADVDAATDAAASLLRSMRCYPWSQTLDDSLLPGIGIDVVADTVFSRDTSATIAESAAAGRTLLSERAAVRFSADRSTGTLLPLGTHRLCDLRPPLALHEWIGGTRGPVDSGDAALNTLVSVNALRQRLDDRPHNLPILLAPLFGRDAAVTQLGAMLRVSGGSRRVVTLTGVGGVGKTRLALEALAAASAAFEDGVWFVPVHGSSEEDVAVAVAETLHLTLPVGAAEPGRTMSAAVGAALTSQRVSLLLDGSEESATNGAIAAFLAYLHEAAPEVACVVTARAPLNLPGETLYPVPPLDVPPVASPGAPGDQLAPVATPASVAMFCDCARRAHPGFVLAGPSDWQSVAAISQRLAGLPLAIELAAAPLGDLTLAEIDARLAGVAERQSPHHRAPSVLRRTIEWANALLDPADQNVLAALSVFAEGFTTADAKVVCVTGDDDEQEMGAVVESLLVLEQRSLIRRVVGGDRFSLLPLVQDFARYRLKQSGREASVRGRHARCFLALAAQARRALDSEREADAYDRLDAEMGNLRAAFDYLRTAEPGAVATLTESLAGFLRHRGHSREFVAWPRLALRLLPPGDDPERALLRVRLTLCRGMSALDTGDLDEAAILLQAAYSAAPAVGDEVTTAGASNLLGLMESRRGNWEVSQAAHAEALERFRRVGDLPGEIAALNNLALLCSRRGEKHTAARYYQSAADLCHARDDRRGLALAVANLGMLALDEGDLITARRRFEEYLRESRNLRDARHIAFALLNLGDAVNQQGEWERGTPLLVIAEALLGRLHHAVSLAEAVRCLDVAAPHYGADRIARLRAEMARLRVPALLRIDPARYTPRTLRLPPVP